MKEYKFDIGKKVIDKNTNKEGMVVLHLGVSVEGIFYLLRGLDEDLNYDFWVADECFLKLA